MAETADWQKRHVLHTQVTWYDTDASGRIHFTTAFRWAEAAEAGLFRAAGIDPSTLIDFPRRHVEAEYLRPLRFGDEVDISIGTEKIGRTSITLGWDASTLAGRVVRGRHTIVRVDASGGPIAVDEAMRRALGRAA